MSDNTHAQTKTPRWALILGASSGFGEGAARALAQAGYDIVGVHLDWAAVDFAWPYSTTGAVGLDILP